MDFMIRLLTGVMTVLLRWGKLQPRGAEFFPVIARIRFLPQHNKTAKAAIAAGRSRKPWLYAGKNYRVMAVYIREKYLIIHGYTLDK